MVGAPVVAVAEQGGSSARRRAATQPRTGPHPESTERIGVAFSWHVTWHLHRLIRLARLVRLVLWLHRLWQVLQRIKIRNHILIVEHLHLLHHLRVRFFRILKWLRFRLI